MIRRYSPIEFETLAQRAFVDIDPLIQLRMVRDRFIDGQAECALRRHLDSLGPDTHMVDIVDCCRVWESHIEIASSRQMGTDGHSRRAVCQMTEDSQSPTGSPGTESLEYIIRKLLPTPEGGQYSVRPGATHTAFTGATHTAIRPPQPVVHGRSKLTDLEVMLQNVLPVGQSRKRTPLRQIRCRILLRGVFIVGS